MYISILYIVQYMNPSFARLVLLDAFHGSASVKFLAARWFKISRILWGDYGIQGEYEWIDISNKTINILCDTWMSESVACPYINNNFSVAPMMKPASLFAGDPGSLEGSGVSETSWPTWDSKSPLLWWNIMLVSTWCRPEVTSFGCNSI